MPEQDHKPPRISDNYVDGSPYLETSDDSSNKLPIQLQIMNY
jgi:hypothetical protein